MVVQTFNPSTQKAEEGGNLFIEAGLGYGASTRTVSKATQRNPVLKKNTNIIKQNRKKERTKERKKERKKEGKERKKERKEERKKIV